MKKNVFFTSLNLAFSTLFLVACSGANSTPSHIHSFSGQWKYNSTHHWHEATCEHTDQKEEYGEHEWDNGVVTKQPTSTTSGKMTYTCTVCEYSKTTTLDPITVDVTGVTLSKTALELDIGGSYTLVETVLPSDASNKNVSWTSSNTSVATVSSYGSVKAVASGKSTITVTTKDGGFKATCEVTVKQIAVTGVSISKTSISIEEGKTYTLTASVTPSNAGNRNVTWSSDNASVATVSSSGVVTGVKPGTATITVTTNDGGFKATCAVTVLEKENASYVRGNPVVDYISGTYSNYLRISMPIKNDGNVNIYVSSCTYDVFNASGALVASVSEFYCDCYPKLLKPGELTYIYTRYTYSGSDTTGLTATPHLSVKNASKTEAIRYDLSNLSLQSDSIYTFKAVGMLTNNNQKASNIIYVAIIVRDKDGNFVMSDATTITTTVNPGESISFSITPTDMIYYKLSASDIGTCSLYAYEYQLVL